MITGSKSTLKLGSPTQTYNSLSPLCLSRVRLLKCHQHRIFLGRVCQSFELDLPFADYLFESKNLCFVSYSKPAACLRSGVLESLRPFLIQPKDDIFSDNSTFKHFLRSPLCTGFCQGFQHPFLPLTIFNSSLWSHLNMC